MPPEVGLEPMTPGTLVGPSYHLSYLGSPVLCRIIASFNFLYRLDSSVGRASAFGAGGRGFEFRGRTIPKV